MEVAEFNALPDPEATALVSGCLGVPRWVADVLAGRPYADRAALRKQAHDAALHLSDDELDAALSRHPRIGERPTGDDDESRHSRAEQSGVADDDADRLRAGNAAYEARFGHVVLIRAAGRTSAEILAELERRLGNDASAEREETVTALRDIALLRLEGAVG
jgi:2-oxo-4-hydroxy-4-carboxy-5-ureidoimidazoline decarboxylase